MKHSQRENGKNQCEIFTKPDVCFFLEPEYIGKSLKPNIETFTDGSSDHLLSVNVKFLLKFEGNVVQKVH